MLQIGGNTFYDCKNKIPMKIPEFKRSGIGTIPDFPTKANAIALVNQTAVLASRHGYRMTTMDGDASVAAYGDSLANFGAVFAAMQETIKSQANSLLVAMQYQLANIQLCMNVGPQPPSSGYVPAQQQTLATTSAMVAVRAMAVVSQNNQP